MGCHYVSNSDREGAQMLTFAHRPQRLVATTATAVVVLGLLLAPAATAAPAAPSAPAAAAGGTTIANLTAAKKVDAHTVTRTAGTGRLRVTATADTTVRVEFAPDGTFVDPDAAPTDPDAPDATMLVDPDAAPDRRAEARRDGECLPPEHRRRHADRHQEVPPDDAGPHGRHDAVRGGVPAVLDHRRWHHPDPDAPEERAVLRRR